MPQQRHDKQLEEQLRGWVLYLMRKYADRYPLDADFARAAGITSATVAQIKSGKRGVGIDVLAKIRRGLSVSVDAMLDGPPATARPAEPLRDAAEPRGGRRSGEGRLLTKKKTS